MPIMAIDWRNPATVAALWGREENAIEMQLAQLNIGRLVAPTDDAFGWDWLRAAQMHKTHGDRPAVA
tara:strand:- start:986 stop:1186 length:201 start_codon:yes stop_codon:yes gene_type:complete